MLSAAFVLSALLSTALAAPAPKEVAKRDISGPFFTVYDDAWLSGGAPPDASQIGNWNVWALAFWLSSGSADMATGWSQLSSDQRSQIASAYSSAGKHIIASAFGATEMPTTQGLDPTSTAQALAQFVKDNGLHGVDVDYEDTAAFQAGTGANWLVTFTKELRNQLPQGQYIISHAPQAPYFTTAKWYPDNAYLAVHQQVGDLIDFYNVQFYNNNDYETCQTLVHQAGIAGTSVGEIIASGIPASKVVIGKPFSSSDASNGYMDAGTLQGCVADAKSSVGAGGVMIWQWKADGSAAGFPAQVWG